MLIGFALALAIAYVVFFANWFKPATIKIYHVTRPSGYAMQTRRDVPAPPITFGLEGDYKLKEIKVVPLAEWQTNHDALPVWHLVADSDPAPVKTFVYGQHHPRHETRRARGATAAASARRGLPPVRHRRKSPGLARFQNWRQRARSKINLPLCLDPRPRQMTGGPIAFFDFPEGRDFRLAAFFRYRTTRVERAARRRMNRRRHVAGQNNALPF